MIDSDGRAVANARVWSDQGSALRTNADGQFALPVRAGATEVVVNVDAGPGFKPMSAKYDVRGQLQRIVVSRAAARTP